MKQYIINHRAVYQILGALRGPDPVGSWRTKNYRPLITLKQEITARVRHTCFEKGECRGVYHQYPVKQIHVVRITGALENLRPVVGMDHYLSHLQDAVYHTTEHKIWDKYGDELVNLLADTRWILAKKHKRKAQS